MKEKALSIYNAHLAIILHHFPDAPKYQQHTAAKKAAVREVKQAKSALYDIGCLQLEAYYYGILTELHKL